MAAGDWFVLDQVQTVGRSVSYTLLPSEIVSKVVVEKSSSASLVEGGVAGSVDIVTRKPLDFTKPFTLEASVGAVYADLPYKTDGQYSALGNFKNDAEQLRRHAAVVLRNPPSAPRRRRNPGLRHHCARQRRSRPHIRICPACSTRREIGAAFFTQERKRNGGMLDIEFKPTDDLTFDLSAFSSKLDGQQLQPQLPVVVDALRQLRRRPGPGPRLRGPEQHPDQGQLHRRTRHLLWRLRPDLAAGRNRDGEFRQSRHHLECQQRTELLRPGRLFLGRRQDAARRMCRRPARDSAAAPATS